MCENIVFGPVPSRRLGRSLGVNNIPYKTCTYSCVYCQLGNTLKMSVNRRYFCSPEKIYDCVKKQIRRVNKIDYITFVPDGEPTLDINIGKEGDILKNLGIPLAILTNSSLLWMEEVREDLLKLDFISLKVDAVSEKLWKKIDRPHKSLNIEKILDGILEFGKEYRGKLVTETMLIGNIEYGDEIDRIGEFLHELNPSIAYVAIPTRPPAEKWVVPPDEKFMMSFYEKFSKKVRRVEYLIGYEGTEFSYSGDIEENILSITSVHPMREDAIKELLKKANTSWDVIEKLINEKMLVEVEYNGHLYYIRRFRRK